MFDAFSFGSSLSARLNAVRVSRSTLWTGFKILLALGLLAILLARTSLAEIVLVFQRAAPLWLAVSWISFWIIAWALARRYWLLIARAIPFHPLFGLVIVQTVIGNLVATSAGAVSYVAMLRAKYRMRATQSISSLILARIGDAIVLWLALAYASWRVWAQVEPLHWLVLAVLVGLGGLLGLCALVVLLRERLVGRVEGLLHRSRLDQFSLVQRMMESLRALSQVPTGEVARLGVPVLSWSVALFALNIVYTYANLAMFQVLIGVDALLFTMCLTQLFSLIPIQVFGGLGVYEVTALALYQMFGLDVVMLAPVLLGIRVLFYVFNLSLLAYLPFERRTEAGNA